MTAKKKMEEVTATGRRKRAVAAVRLRRGSGKVDINGRAFEEYFPLALQRQAVLAPIERLGLTNQYDLVIRVKGGGLQGQTIASRLGISRALVAENGERRGELKGFGFLTRDPRKRERKKFGRAGARKSFQFSKR